MRYVYLLQSIADPTKRYIGSTFDLRRLLDEDNYGKSVHTSHWLFKSPL